MSQGRHMPQDSPPPQDAPPPGWLELAEELPLAMMRVDHQGVIRTWNRAARELTGLAEERVVGVDCCRLLDCGRHPAGCVCRQVLEHGQAAGPRDQTLRLADGEQLPVRVWASPRADGGAVVVWHDISQIQTLKRQRDAIISMLGHDMKSPLVSIRGFAGMLLKRPQEISADKAAQFLSVISRQAERLESLVNDFLDCAHLQSGNLELSLARMQLTPELTDLQQLFAPRFAEIQGSLELTLESALPPLTADCGRLRRALTNLLENALHHSPPGGRVVLGARTEDGQILIWVSDQGPGIPAAELDMVFKPFYRGADTQTGRGHGLGLAGVRSIMEAHGGRAWVDSPPGQGATFRLELPLGPRSAVPTA